MEFFLFFFAVVSLFGYMLIRPSYTKEELEGNRKVGLEFENTEKEVE